MDFDFLQLGIITFLILLPILYETCSWFKYYAKMSFYNFMIMFQALVLLPALVLRPRNVENYKIVSAVFNIWSRILGIAVEVRGQAHTISKQPCIFVSNHQSSLDMIGMMHLLPDRCTFLAKRELMFAGTFGIASWFAGIVFIDRLNPQNARQTMAKTVDHILKNNIKLWIFPEGTRNHQGGMLPFKKGSFHLAIQAQVPIVPIVYGSLSNFYSKPEHRFSTGTMILECLPPIPTEGLTGDDAGDLSDRVRQQMLDVYNKISLENSQAKLAATANGGGATAGAAK